jgi:hypothetical protein
MSGQEKVTLHRQPRRVDDAKGAPTAPRIALMDLSCIESFGPPATLVQPP